MVCAPLQTVFCYLVLLATVGTERRRDQLQFGGQVVVESVMPRAESQYHNLQNALYVSLHNYEQQQRNK